jgi:hypothetical protein
MPIIVLSMPLDAVTCDECSVAASIATIVVNVVVAFADDFVDDLSNTEVATTVVIRSIVCVRVGGCSLLC